MRFKSSNIAFVLAGGLTLAVSCSAQIPLSCSLGRVTERIAPLYPDSLNGRPVQGVVSLLATFAPDGKVTSSKVIAGPAALRFESEAYVRGWRAEASNEVRQCNIVIEYRFDGSQGVCGSHREVQIRPERLDETHVLMHLGCDIW